MATASSRPGRSSDMRKSTNACATTGELEAPDAVNTDSVAATVMSGMITLQAGAEPLAGYRLIRFLGQGGFGVVWEAEAPGGFRVALKFIWLYDPRAGRELRALDVVRRLHHPHLLDVQFSVVRDSYLVLAMPLCDQSLADRLRACQGEGRLGIPAGELLRYMKELAAAVDYLNEPAHPLGDGRVAGIQHRDIKPSNILLAGGSVRLADFGLAKMLVGAVEPHSGCMLPHYIAPEEIQGQVSRMSDQYAVAVTYVQLRTGRLPFGGSIGTVLEGHLHREPDLSGLPEGERAIVGRALSKQPEERWGSCSEFVDRLGRVAESLDAALPLGVPRSGAVGDLPRAWHDVGCGHSSIMTRPRRIGLAAMSVGLIGIAAVMSSVRVTPLEHPGRAHRSSSHPVVPRHRRNSPVHQAPRSPRGPAGRRVRGQFHGRDELAFQRADLRRRGAGPPRHGSSVHLAPVYRC